MILKFMDHIKCDYESDYDKTCGFMYTIINAMTPRDYNATAKDVLKKILKNSLPWKIGVKDARALLQGMYKKCHVCAKTYTCMPWCGKCNRVYYCTRDCQAADFVKHRKKCVK